VFALSDDARLLAKAATLPYRGGLSQQQIAQRQAAGRLLRRARDLDIVHVEIRPPLSYSTELECALEEAFHLSEAIIVTPPVDTDESIKEAIGKAAAAFVERRVRDDDIIGLSWSTTVYQCAMHIQPVRVQNITVVSLDGSLNRTSFPTHAEYIVHQMAQAFGGRPVLMPAPMVVDRPDIKDSLLSDSHVAEALELARRANLAIFGIGDLSEQSSPFKAGYINREELHWLRSAGVVGDICGQFYDLDGSPNAPDLVERTIAVELSNLCSKEISVGVAGGLHKVDAIFGALQGRYCNVLIADEATASALLDRVRKRQPGRDDASRCVDDADTPE
jgi:deoxyribonucleoside regulator